MRDRELHQRDMDVAWDGWAIPEVLAGAIVGAVIGLALVAILPGVSNVIPDVAGVALGALAGATLSWALRPRRITVRTQAGMTKEERTVRSHAA